MGFTRSILLFPVQLYQSMVLALAQIRGSKMRSLLTALGIVIGVASVTTVVAALTGMKSNVLSSFESLGTNKVFIFPSRPDSGPKRNAHPNVIRFSPDLFDGLIEHCPSIASMTRIVGNSASVTYHDRTEEAVDISGIEPAWHDIEHTYVQLGRPFSLLDNTQARPVCLINPALRDKLGLARDCTGDSIVITGRRYMIVGVIESKTESSMFRDGASDSQVYVPFNTAWRAQLGKTFLPFMHVTAAAKTPDVAEEAKAEATFYLRKRRKLMPGEPNTFQIEYVSQFVQQFNNVATGITMVATGVVGISLLVGGVGIMNIMLVSVSERTREIGLRKAVGARPSAILLQFLVEAIVLCLVGGLIGVMIGEGLTRALRQIPGASLQSAAIPVWAIAMSFGFAASVGLVFGMFPAIKAARLDPIEALRHE